MIPADTDPQAYAVQLEIWRRMSTKDKFAQVVQLSNDTRSIVMDGVRNRHPEYDDEQVKHASFRLFLGDMLYRKVWPDRKLLTP
ncbi:MAG: hypothetical protein QNK37_19275 [Acidobacteriota bacterium]|nr:hypothetical protein [Acidobacteriota bacterium]